MFKWFVLFCFPLLLSSQNLLTNSSFEDLNLCSEYEALCAPEAWFRIPPSNLDAGSKTRGYAFDGEQSEMVVIENVRYPISYRVFLYTKILCPLIKDETYVLSFYLNPTEHEAYRLHALFSEKEIISKVINPIGLTPSLVITSKDEKKKFKKNWRKIEVEFVANGSESFLTFGNFDQEEMEFEKRQKMTNFQDDLIYILDDVQLYALNDTSKVPCQEYFENKELLYASNHRHVYKKGINKKKIQIDTLIKIQPKVELTMESASPVMDTLLFEIPQIAFEFDQYQLLAAYFPKLDSLNNELSKLDILEVKVVGHTDSRGPSNYNQALSEKRAKRIRNYILKGNPNLMDRIEDKGMGEYQPRATNETEEGRALNRRVEIKIIHSLTVEQ